MKYLTREETIELEKTRLEGEIEKTKKDFSKSLGNVLYHLSDYLWDNKKNAINFSINFLEQLAETNMVDIGMVDSLIEQLQTIYNPDNFELDLTNLIKSVVNEVTTDYVENSDYQEDYETISYFESRYRQTKENYHDFTR